MPASTIAKAATAMAATLLSAGLAVAAPEGIHANAGLHYAAAATRTASTSSVHNSGGARFDVPPCLLRRDGSMINGLPPEAAEFE